MNTSDAGDTGFFGILSDISLEDYIQLICMKNATKAIRVTQQDEKGLIFIDQGRIIFSSQDKLIGTDALYHILSWKKGSFREVKFQKLPLPNIDTDYRSLLLEASRRKQDKKQPADDLNGNDFNILSSANDTKAKKTPIAKSKEPQSLKPLEETPAGIPRKKKRALLALTAILPICAIALLLLVLNFTDRLPFPAFAVTSQKTPQASSMALQPTAQSETAAQSISIGSLVTSSENKIFPEETILRLHGSNTIGAKLAPALISGYLTTILGAERVEQFPGKQDNEVMIKARFKDSIKVVEIHAHGSTTGFKGLGAELCEIGMSSRKIKEKEIAELSTFGEMTAPTNEHVIALDGIAVIVNKGNKIDTLNMQQLTDIFSGKTTDWSQLGGAQGEIAVYARDDNSGTYDTFKSIVLDKLDLKQGIKRFESNPELSEQVSRDPLSIGFTSLPSINKAKAISIADAGAKPIFPSFFTVATEDYPIARRLYLYTATYPKNNHVRDFIEYVHSRQGQEIANKIDFVDMNIKTFHSDKIDQAHIKNIPIVQDYLRTIDNAQRLSLNFRFNTGKVTLDNRGERDLTRVVDFLKERLDKKIILAGFADNAGDYDVNLKLAKIRAETVAEQLRTRGIAVQQIASAGEELPVATNLSTSGKEKNRRVEVWLK